MYYDDEGEFVVSDGYDDLINTQNYTNNNTNHTYPRNGIGGLEDTPIPVYSIGQQQMPQFEEFQYFSNQQQPPQQPQEGFTPLQYHHQQQSALPHPKELSTLYVPTMNILIIAVGTRGDIYSTLR